MESNGMSHVTLNRPEDLHQIATRNLAHDEHLAQSDGEGTRDLDVRQYFVALLMHIDGESPCDVLDIGGGPGRDLRIFKMLGQYRSSRRRFGGGTECGVASAQP